MDKIVCVIEPHRAIVYDICLGKSVFQEEHSLEELPFFLQTLRAWNRILHVLDLSSTMSFKWERSPDGLTWWERMQWFREKIKQFSQDGHHNLWSINRRQHWLWYLKITKPILPQWIEQKLQAQCVSLFYHSYPLELIRNVKIHFDASYEKFQCFILQRLDSPSVFAVYYENVLVFLRLLFPMPQESLTQLIQETVRHVEESFHTHNFEFVYLGDQEAGFLDIHTSISKGQHYYGDNLEKWMKQHSIFSVMRCESLLDRFVLAQAPSYQSLKGQGKRFVLNTLEPKLRRFSWIQIFPLVISLYIFVFQWRWKAELQNSYNDVLCQWKKLPWNDKQFLEIEKKLHDHQKQYLQTVTFLQQMEQVIPEKSFLETIEWTKTKGLYGFNFSNFDKMSQKNLLMAAWRQHMPSKSIIQWKENLSSSLNEMEELDYCEGGSPFSVDP
ncbi:hypothetical protein HE1_00327 [Holospora elegans E1]|uniref:Uncharacterized protein n=1 Tax=Holospora elegans E1 TaxID=1427503 RepID=A0A023DYW2_9PROT|nr:hypothetical protein [Holospora elegans]GAJ46007.1 hypothetical protein HE1_00327 [Holospora elegans E1]